MSARAATFVLALSLLPRLSAAQEFPPPDDAAKLHEGEPLRVWSFPIGIGGGRGWPAGHMHDNLKFTEAFSSLNALQLDAGVAYKAVGVSFVYRRGFATAGDLWCTAGQSCTAKLDSIGGALLVHPTEMGRSPSRVSFKIGVGFAQNEGEVKVDGAAQARRVTGWSLYEITSVGAKLGDVTSRLSLGGYAMLHFMSFEKYEPASLDNAAEDKNPNTPILFELGVRLGFD